MQYRKDHQGVFLPSQDLHCQVFVSTSHSSLGLQLLHDNLQQPKFSLSRVCIAATEGILEDVCIFS